MWGGGGDTRITATPQDLEIAVGWWGAEEEMMRGIVPAGAIGANVNEQSSGG